MPREVINGHNMYYEVHGEGAPVLCMSGWGTMCHGRAEKMLPHSLLEGGYQLIYFDHRGIGESDDDTSLTPSTLQYADDAAGLLTHIGHDQVHVIGIGGMGGLIGQQLAIHHHDRVLSLAMNGPWAKVDAYLADQLKMFRTLHDKIGHEAFQILGALFCYLPEYYNEHRDRIISSQGGWQMLMGKPEAHSRFIQACLEHDTRADLGRIDQPTLLVMGGVEDLMTGDRIGRVMKEGIPHAEYVILEGAPHSHQSVPEAHERFGEILGDFLQRQVAATPVTA